MKTKTKRRKQGTTTGLGSAELVEANQNNWRVKLQQARLKFDDPAKRVFLKEYAEHGLKGKAAKAAGVCTATIKVHSLNDPEFAEAMQEAAVEYRDKIVGHATKLALEGTEIKRFNRSGDLLEQRKEYPIRLIELELKRVEPGYRDKQTIDVQHGGGIMVAPAAMTPEEWVAQQEKQNKIRLAPVIDVIEAEAQMVQEEEVAPLG